MDADVDVGIDEAIDADVGVDEAIDPDDEALTEPDAAVELQSQPHGFAAKSVV